MKQTLSQADLQRIERMLSDRSRALQAHGAWAKDVAKSVWGPCNKEDPNTLRNFRLLNHLRSGLRQNKAERKNIDSMIHSIRKMIRAV